MRINLAEQKQTVLGWGIEVQFDSISNECSTEDTDVAVPHSLRPEWRERLYDEVLRHFRYLRLAMGLYVRGELEEGRVYTGRKPWVLSDIRDLVEGNEMEVLYTPWTQPTAFKINRRLDNGLTASEQQERRSNTPGWRHPENKLADFSADGLRQLGEAHVRSIRHLNDNGIPINHFSLQNEPDVDTVYSSCWFTHEEYLATFKGVVPIVKEAFPDMVIYAVDSSNLKTAGQLQDMLAADTEAFSLVDWWCGHAYNCQSDPNWLLLPGSKALLVGNAHGKPWVQTEFAFLGSYPDNAALIIAQVINHFMTEYNSPTFYWLHALRDKDFHHTDQAGRSGHAFGGLDTKTGTYELYPTWHGFAPFAKHVLRDSVRLAVEGERPQGIFTSAYLRPDGKIALVLINASGHDQVLDIGWPDARPLEGTRYSQTHLDFGLGQKNVGEPFSVSAGAIDVWVG